MSQEINLLPQRAARKAFNATSAQGAAAGVGVAAVCAVLLAAYENHVLQGVQREAQGIERAVKEARAIHEKAQAARAARKPDASPDAKLAELEAQLQGRQQVLEALKSGAVGAPSGFSQYMLALSRQSLPGVWLTAFDFAAGATEVTLTGRALRPDLVPAYLQRLTQEAPLQGRRFASMVISQPARAADAKGGNATPAYVEFEISSEPSQRAAAPSPGALPAPLIKPDPPLGTAPAPQASKPEADK